MLKATYLLAISLGLTQIVLPSDAAAVGNGVQFGVDESTVPALVNSFASDSMDLTYHACVKFSPNDPGRMEEHGYFWISSYQQPGSVIDSQVNHFLGNGYHIYGVYSYQAQQVGISQPTPTGKRLNYVVNPGTATITLYLDPDQDTTIKGYPDCGAAISITGTADDREIGSSIAVAQGEKSETNGLANGDFKLVFSDWVWAINSTGPCSGEVNPCPIRPNTSHMYNFLVFNGNVTLLRGALGEDHSPEGSGNLFWRQYFDPKPWNPDLGQ
ncbi:MAG: hypothetical protein GXP08_06610 [Gammaproteobacteria bacterium]|nr:hypothetical protein [Gammaproteobacteria bacterium]